MKHIIYLFGSLKAIYSGMYAEYKIDRSRRELLLKMSYELHNLGFFIMRDGSTLYRKFYINDDRFKAKLKMLAMKTDSNRFILKDDGVYLVRDYKYYNVDGFLKYIFIPIVVAMVTAITIII